MKRYRYNICLAQLLLVVVTSVLLTACAKDFQDDIDDLNSKFSSVDQRVSKIESQVSAINTQLNQLSVLATAVEQNFYVTQVKTTDGGYELTMSNGSVIVLQNGSDNKLAPMPAVSMTQLGGLYFWTMNGMLITGADGQPIRTAAKAPVVKYDFVRQLWLVSIDGGVTFQDINVSTALVINDEVLLQVINNYVRQNSTTAISQQVLFQIVSTYIQQHYAELFNITVLDEVVVNYVNQRYTRIFSYELMEKIFSQYNYQYITSQIKVNSLVNAIVSFIQEHKEIFMDNEVLYEIVSSYLKVNKTSVFTDELLLEVINSFVANNKNFIDVDLLTQVVTNYVDQHQDVIFNTETIRTFLLEYVRRYYTQIFTQDILVQLLNSYVVENGTTIFSKTLLEEVLNTYLKNNYTVIFSTETITEIVNNYIKKNSTTFINHDVLIEVITAYFEKNYSLFIDRTVISTAINNYISTHQSTIIDVDIVSQIVSNYMELYYAEVFSYEMLSQVIYNYFETNQQVIGQYVSEGTDIIMSVKVENDLCTITLRSGETVRLVVYDAYARLRDRVQNIVAMSDGNGHFSETYNQPGGLLNMNYLVAPASMAQVIRSRFNSHDITLELKATDANGSLKTLSVSSVSADNNGVLHVSASTSVYGTVKTVALHVKENKMAGTDVMTEFTPVDAEAVKPRYLKCPDDHHPHMIDMGLPSGTLWSCCNVEASKPEDYGGYYAWGETETKETYNWSTYLHKGAADPTDYADLGADIAGTQYDVAYVKWGAEWQMPSDKQFKELVDRSSSVWTTQNGVYGRKFTGTNGGTIFFPATGVRFDDSNISLGGQGCYWASTIYMKNELGQLANSLFFFETSVYVGGPDAALCEYGNPVRPIAK